MNDKKLWNKIQKDDNQALRVLFDLYYRVLCSYMSQFTKNTQEVEDIVQNTYIKLWANRKAIKLNTSLKSYLFKAAYNAYIDKYREKKRNEIALEQLKYEAFISEIEEDEILFTHRIERMKSVVEELPTKCKEIILLSKKEGYKNKEIALKLNISIKTVESQIRIAFQKIRESF